jgi:hypothetical protein
MRRQYVGCGPEAERIAEQDRQAREHRDRQRKEVKRLEANVAGTKRAVEGLIEQSDLLLAACLLTTGYHHHRGEWRRRRT